MADCCSGTEANKLISHLYVGDSSTNAANAATTNGSTYIKIGDNATSKDAKCISGSGKVSVSSDTSGNIIINGAGEDMLKYRMYAGTGGTSEATSDNTNTKISLVESGNTITAVSRIPISGTGNVSVTSSGGTLYISGNTDGSECVRSGGRYGYNINCISTDNRADFSYDIYRSHECGSSADGPKYRNPGDVTYSGCCFNVWDADRSANAFVVYGDNGSTETFGKMYQASCKTTKYYLDSATSYSGYSSSELEEFFKKMSNGIGTSNSLFKTWCIRDVENPEHSHTTPNYMDAGYSFLGINRGLNDKFRMDGVFAEDIVGFMPHAVAGEHLGEGDDGRLYYVDYNSFLSKSVAALTYKVANINTSIVDPSVSAETEEIASYIKGDGMCCKADSARTDFFIGTDTYQLGPWQMYNYFAGAYNGGPRLHCPIFKSYEDIDATGEGGAWAEAQKGLYSDTSMCGRIFTPRYSEIGIVLCGYDNICSTGTSPKTWTIYNNGGNFSIARNGNHSESPAGGRGGQNWLRCEVAGTQSDKSYAPNQDANEYWDSRTTDTAKKICAALIDKPNSAGNVQIPSTTEYRKWYIDSNLNITSDRRIKNNIQDLSDEKCNYLWENSDNLIKQFELKSMPGETKYGVIAQEVREILSDVVSGLEDEKNLLHVDYESLHSALIGMLIHKTKELEKENKELKDKFKSIEDRLSALENN